MSPPSAEAGPPDEGLVPVIISFAASDALTVQEAAAALQARGHEITLVEGVESDAAALTGAIERLEGEGLYVLCRSPALPRDAIDQLRAMLRSNGVPFGRTLTLALESKRARALEERIVSVLKRMVTGRGALPRPVVPMAAPPAEPDEETDTEIRPPGDSNNIALANGLSPEVTQPVNSDEIAAWADSLVGKIPSDLQAELLAEPLAEPPPDASGPWPTPGEPAPPELQGLGPAPDHSDPNAATARLPGAFEVGAPDLSGVGGTAIAPPTQPPPNAPYADVPVQTSHTIKSPALDPSAMRAEDQTSLDDDLEDVSFVAGGKLSRAIASPKGLALVAGGALALVLVVVGVKWMSGDDDADEVAADDRAHAQTEAGSDEAKAESNDADAKADDADAPPPTDDADDAAADDDGGGDAPADDGGAAPLDDDTTPTPVEPVEPPPEPGVSSRKPLPEEPDVVPPDPAAVAATPGPGEAVIAAALRDREVRALDIFIVSPESDDMSFESAQSYCAGLEVAGIGGWRLPSAGELNSLGTAKLVKKGVYWSRTLGDIFGDTRLVLNAKRDRLSAAPISWEGAAAVCLRPRS